MIGVCLLTSVVISYSLVNPTRLQIDITPDLVYKVRIKFVFMFVSEVDTTTRHEDGKLR